MRNNINAGRMRQRVTLQRVSQTVDSVGQPTETWTDLATVWAEVISLESSGNGREFIKADSIGADQVYTVRMRYYAGLTPKDRVQLGSKILQIDSVSNVDELNRITHLFCVENAAVLE